MNDFDFEVALNRLRGKLAALDALPPPAARRKLRERAGVSQREVAEVCGVSQTAVLSWESGSKTPRGAHLERYAAVLDLLAGQGAA